MEIKLYNTLSRSLETFKPIKNGAVSMYHCGPTVYDTPHIGNYRTFVMNDLIRRIFEYNDYKVDQAMNITDVDDKIIKKSREESVSLENVTRKYEALFLEELKSLNILMPHHVIRATDHIGDMISLIEQLVEKGVAYKANDGVYMSIEKVKDYGALAHLKIDVNSNTHSCTLKNIAPVHERIINDEYDKDSPHDFALWKFKTIDDGDNSWDASFGTGRPGWHIECSAMAMKMFPFQSQADANVDIHSGGIDLIFPHHTNEIAQSESVLPPGKKFVHYWMHGAFMNILDDKMAKSKGNIVKLDTLHDEMISPLAYRYWLLTAHYRSPVNFTLEAVHGAQNALIKLMTMISNLRDGKDSGVVLEAYKKRFITYINEDMSLPQVVALVWELMKDTNVFDADKRATILDFDRVFGLNLGSLAKIEDEEIPEEINVLADAREEARKVKEWDKADALRQEIENRGFAITDTSDGIKITSK